MRARHAVEKEQAIEMVQLMSKGAGLESVCLDDPLARRRPRDQAADTERARAADVAQP